MKKSAWEVFCDYSYYDLWAVRPVGDKDFDSPQLFHFVNREDADAFKALVERAICAMRSP